MADKLICSSCKNPVTNMGGSVMFMCPQCGKHEIVRCKHCRVIAAKYTCPQCQFEGPN